MTRPLARAPSLARSASLALALLVAPCAASAQTVAAGSTAQLRGLDKVSGATTDIELAVGASTTYGRLSIRLLGCRYPADNANADAFAFLEIRETQRDERLFYGWMIASAPALNALDHARYDVWVLGCR